MRKFKKKNLTQAVILGLLLAVPLGVQATDYTDPIRNMYDGTMIDEYNLKNNSSSNPIRTYKVDGKTQTYTYTFDNTDKLIVTDVGIYSAAVQLDRFEYEEDGYKNINFDLKSLKHIEVEDMAVPAGDPNRVAIDVRTAYYDYTENITLKLWDSIEDSMTIKAAANSKYVAGIYAIGAKIDYDNWDIKDPLAVNISMGKVNMEVVSSYKGKPQDQLPSTSTGVFGISGNTGSTITVGDGSTINVTANGDGWLKAWGVTGQFEAKKIEMGNSTEITVNNTAAKGGEAVGIYNDSGEVILGNNSKINATLDTPNAAVELDDSPTFIASGVWVQDYSGALEVIPTVSVGAGTEITVSNQKAKDLGKDGQAYGIHAGFGTVTADDNLSISTTAAGKGAVDVMGVIAYSAPMPNRDKNLTTQVELGSNASISATNNAESGGLAGIYAFAYGNVENNVKVEVGNDSKILVTADKGNHDTYGVFATSKKSNVNLGTTAIQVENNSADITVDTVGIGAADGSTVTMAGGSILGKNADAGEFKAIETSTKGSVTVGDGNKVVQIEGSLIANNNSDITMKAIKAGSYLLGTITTDGGERGKGSTTNLTLGEGTSWQLTGDSNVTNLNLGDGGIVSMVQSRNGTFDSRIGGNAHKLSVDKYLEGNGTFVMDLTYHDGEDNNVQAYEDAADSDFIYVHGGDGHEQTIAFEDTKTTNLGLMKADDKLYFARVKGDTARFGDGDDTTIDGKYNTVTAANKKGIYDYQFYVKSENNQKEPDYNDWFITCKTNENNPNGDSPFHSYNAGFALWRDDDTLLKRLGELRFTNDEGGVWVRVIGKKLEDNRYLGFNTHAKTIQVGYDRKDVQEDGSGTWRKGFAIGYTEADTTFRSGKGENNYTDLTLYATNIRKHDHYWDLVARIGLINSEYDSAYGDHGDFDNWAGSISAEYGRKKKLNEDNWFIEPQAQLTYSYMWGDNYTTRNGIRVEQGDADSLLGRAGFVISKEIESERKYPHRYYAKAFVMHEFLDGGEGRMFFGGDHRYESCDFKDTWYVVGVGANVDMGNQCTFYFDAEKNFKAHIKMPYRIEAGLRWEF